MNFVRKSEDNDENQVLLSDGLSNLLNKKTHKLFVRTHQVYLEKVVVSDHRKERNVQKGNERKSVERMDERV